MIPTLRTMTRKSKLGFGKYKDFTVQKMFDMPKKIDLISAYYKLSSINYTDDILKDLGITKKYQIQKPGIDKDMYYIFLNENRYKKPPRGTGPDKLKTKTKPFSKKYMQSKNQG